jgi:subtilisin family serine protease
MQSPKKILSTAYVVVLLSALTLGSASLAYAAPQKMVVPGKEIAIRLPRSAGFTAQSNKTVKALKVPGKKSVTSIGSRGRVGVLALSDAQVAAFAAKSPVVANEGAIAKKCQELRSLNPGLDILCEPNTLFFKSATPNDPKYNQLYGMTKISAPVAWDTLTGSAAVKVAVIDTGIDYSHADLNANISINAGEIPGNGVDDDANGYVDDYLGYNFAYSNGDPYDDDGHGTHCAGTIGARGNNGVGVVGVNWQVGLLAVKVLDNQGSGYLSDIAAGIDYAVARGASVISMSLGGSDNSSILEDAIAGAKAADILVVVAAGNETANNDVTPSYPANSVHENVISVAATTSSDSLASFSNWGRTTVHVAAPGNSIVSTIPGGYASYSGTSMATPHVAGVAALMKAANSGLSYAQVKSILMQTVDPISSLSTRVASGGRINAASAVAMAVGTTPSPSDPAPAPTPTPEPDPDSPPVDDSPDSDAYYLTLKAKRRGSVAILSGRMTDAWGDAVSDENVDLLCSGKVRGSSYSSSSGSYSFRLKRPSSSRARAVRCRVENDYGETSSTVRVR